MTLQLPPTQPTWDLFCTLFCTTSPSRSVFLFARVNDEIEAVAAFRAHVADFGDDHLPHIFMHPTTDAGRRRITPLTNRAWAQFNSLEELGYDLDRNLYRPEQVGA